jgi:NAD(P)-dependent dehydrogenase (short-subunit alcohol dehydrogenase family)
VSAQVMLVTGASSGMGRACAERFHRQGWKVYAASRTIEGVGDLECAKLTMDVRDASVEQGVARIVEWEGRLDAVVHCAGFGLAGAVEDTSLAEAQAQFDTNFFSALRLCRAALPIMRGQGAGILVVVGSLGGLVGAPFQALYSATKFALEGFVEALRMEVKPFGIRVVLIEPGNVRSKFTANRQCTVASSTNPAYRDRFEVAIDKIERAEMAGPDPAVVAALIDRVVKDPRPKLRYPVGRLDERIAVRLKPLLPHRVYEALAMWYFGA